MTIRKEVIGDATLYCGSMEDVMPTLGHVDHVISDPPYEDELHKAIGRIRRNDGRKMIADLGFGGVNSFRPEAARLMVAASSGWVILFTLADGVRAWRDDLQAAGAKWDTCLAWVKPDSAPRFNGQGAARGFECAVTCWAGAGYRSWNAGGKRGVYTYSVNQGREGQHPTEKPVGLMAEIIGDYTRPAQLVCDPFAGSGTTGVACARLGRSFVGIERDPRWFDLACRRIEEAYRQPRLAIDVPQKPVQTDMLGGDA